METATHLIVIRRRAVSLGPLPVTDSGRRLRGHGQGGIPAARSVLGGALLVGTVEEVERKPYPDKRGQYYKEHYHSSLSAKRVISQVASTPASVQRGRGSGNRGPATRPSSRDMTWPHTRHP